MFADTLEKLANVLNFVKKIKENDLRGLAAREQVIDSIVDACVKTRKLTHALDAGYEATADGIGADAVSASWHRAAGLMARYDKNVANEFEVKAYGWATGVWDSSEISVIPRKVEEILNEALALRAAFKPILTETIVH
ncbi:hypothetical protein [Rhizobium leguminosarum]|uniref:hypothetical protein n=1 Tax=Rhizobium leguminosarum TaxID=384 RepID=UPI001C94A1FE|nr:hypothetical protein [Rhizobium leguminosarum]MBY5426991.1 hypothetical protein [Rhizobium leguminosarum]